MDTDGFVAALRRNRFAVLAAALIVLLLTVSFERTDAGFVSLVTATLYTFIALAGLYATQGQGFSRWIGISLGALLIATIWIDEFVRIHEDVHAALRLGDIFFLYLFVRIVSSMLSSDETNSERVFAAICGYIVAAILFSSVYRQILWFDAEAFRGLREPMTRPSTNRDMLYFSFVTQTTLGYGDISPVNSQARALAMVQSTIGVIYLATTIASLVAQRDSGHESR